MASEGKQVLVYLAAEPLKRLEQGLNSCSPQLSLDACSKQVLECLISLELVRMQTFPPHTFPSMPKLWPRGKLMCVSISAVTNPTMLKTQLGRNTGTSVGPVCYYAAPSASQPSSVCHCCWKHASESPGSMSAVWPSVGKAFIDKRRRNKRMGRPHRQSPVTVC